MKFDMRSLSFKLWMYFTLFAGAILLLLWLLQIVFLNSFYKSMKIHGVMKLADTIISRYGQEDFESTIDQLTFRNSILVFVTDTQGNILYTSDEHGNGAPKVKKPIADGSELADIQRPLPRDFDQFINRLSKSADGRVLYTMRQDRFEGQTLVYGAILDNTILYITTPLDPVDATIGILKTQLIYITAVALLLGFIISFFIARKFSKPISKITATAGLLAVGNYDATFEKGFYSEIDQLAASLNHTADELSKVEKLRRELIANISHDLRTPLTMIKAYSEMIRDITGDKKEKREANLKIIIDETDRLSTLVNDILDLSVVQSGSETLRLDNVDLSSTVKKILSRFEAFAEKEGYTIKVKLDHDIYVLADQPRIEQVLYNLIGNAFNYIGEDKLITVNLIDLGGRARFEVIDNGIGIPEEETPYIWDRYYKSKNHRRSVVGNGLGLSIVKSILELHNAKFGVDSKVGQGSKFWFELKK